MSNKAIVQDGYNKEDPLSTVKLVSKPIPTAGPGQVVVRMTMRPINPTDFISLRNGLVGGDGSGIFGSEGCGVVHQVCTLPGRFAPISNQGSHFSVDISLILL
jgi:NADPH:quinone reductase-like Zn-dependent oxidoreductase